MLVCSCPSSFKHVCQCRIAPCMRAILVYSNNIHVIILNAPCLLVSFLIQTLFVCQCWIAPRRVFGCCWTTSRLPGMLSILVSFLIEIIAACSCWIVPCMPYSYHFSLKHSPSCASLLDSTMTTGHPRQPKATSPARAQSEMDVNGD